MSQWFVVTERKPDGSVILGVSSEANPKRWVCSIKPQPDLPFEVELDRANTIAAAPEMLMLLQDIFFTGFGPQENKRVEMILNKLGVKTNE